MYSYLNKNSAPIDVNIVSFDRQAHIK